MNSARISYPRLAITLLVLMLAGCSSSSVSDSTDDTQPSTPDKSAKEVTGHKANGTTKSINRDTAPRNAGSGREADLDLISGSSRGDTQAVKGLLEQGADVHARDDTGGTTPLIAIAYENHVDTARVLIEAGADVNVKDETQQSAYLISTSEIGDDPRLLKLTLANGADVESLDSFNGTGLIRAAERGYVQIVRELLKTEVDVNHVNNLGWTALLEAIILGDCGPSHTEVVRLLVEAGADANLADGSGVTPLQHSQRQDCAGIAEILKDAGAE
ncbi:hypothetical protein BH23ACT11_BH23ACT11_14190 [soil metagenome]